MLSGCCYELTKIYIIITINPFQGCTSTVILVWMDHNEEVFAQCANVGDSACVIKYVFLHISLYKFDCSRRIGRVFENPFFRTVAFLVFFCIISNYTTKIDQSETNG